MPTQAATTETRLNVRLSGHLADHANRRVETSLYNTHSEYIRDLVRRDMEAEMLASMKRGDDDIAAGRYAPMDTLENDLKMLRANSEARKK